MKKLKIFFVTFFMLFTCNLVCSIYSATTDKLMTVGDSSHNITITKGTTIEDIEKVLGKPKIQTVSAFGGQAYTFYTDDDYNNYLYVETTKEGKIASYGSVDPTYKIYDNKTQGYGDEYDFYNSRSLHGYLYSNSGIVGGGVYYNPDALYEGDSSANKKTVDFFISTYESNPTKYLRGISEHAVTMYNALSTRLGNKTNLEFNEDFFYINEQFKKLGTSTRKYIRDMNKNTTYMKGIYTLSNVDLTTNNYYVLCPMHWANLVRHNLGVHFEDKNQAVFDYDFENRELYAIALRKDVYDKVNAIELTPEEQSKLSAGRYEFNQSKINFAKDSDIFEIEPVATSASGLIAGKLKASKEQAILDYVNAIRVAGGIPKLTLDRDSYTTAQYISTLMTYRYNVLKLEIQHHPEKPTGVSDEYYNIAIGHEKAFAENLGRTANVISVNNMKKSINELLDDGAENPQFFSHRQKILHASYTDFGYGISPNMYSNEFYGTRDTDVFLEAWPSNGITFLETYTDRTKWTAQFVDKYKVTDTTTASIKCLNTNEVYEFNKKEHTSSREYSYYPEDGDSLSTMYNKIIMYDSKIIPQQGYVYEITLNNLKDKATGALTKYTYRTVFEYGDTDNYPSGLSGIKISVPENLKKVNGKDVYYVPIDEETELNVNIDANVADKKITWSSSNSDAVQIRQDGVIIAKKKAFEDVTITVCYDGANITDQIVVRPYRKINSVKLDKTEAQLYCENASKQGYGECTTNVKVIKTPEDGTEAMNVRWTVTSQANPDHEYEINAPNIKKYIEVTTVYYDPYSANIKVISTEENNNVYTVTAHVTGVEEEYTASCKITVYVPIEYIEISSAITELKINGNVMNIDYNNYNKNTFDLTATAFPTNNTDSDEVTWTVEDGTVVSKANEKGKFNILKEGTTKIYAQGEHGTKGEVTVNISAPLLKLYLNKSDTAGKKTITISDDKVTTDKLQVTKEPAINSDVIKFKTNNDKVATVNDEGVVTFKSKGEVTITAYSEKNNSVTAEYKYTVIDNFLKGDMNLDKLINSTDAALVLDRYKNDDETDEDLARGDMNGDGILNSTDAAMILDIYKNS